MCVLSVSIRLTNGTALCAAQDETDVEIPHLIAAGHKVPILDAQAVALDASTAASAIVLDGEIFSVWLHETCDTQGPVYVLLWCTQSLLCPSSACLCTVVRPCDCQRPAYH